MLNKATLLYPVSKTGNTPFCIDFTDSTVDGSLTISSDTLNTFYYSINDSKKLNKYYCS